MDYFDLAIKLSKENTGMTLALNASLNASAAMGGTEEHSKGFAIPYCECKDGSDNLHCRSSRNRVFHCGGKVSWSAWN